MITISKSYEEVVNTGNYENVRVGLTITSDRKLETAEEVIAYSNTLLELAKVTVKNEVLKIKQEKGVK